LPGVPRCCCRGGGAGVISRSTRLPPPRESAVKVSARVGH
ncbi:hypothetical protein NJB18185_21040, partial [Mycobacterium montefiorense]